MTVLREIVLASASPRRLYLLRSLGLNVRVAPSSYHEPDIETLTPRELASAHACEKTREVAAQFNAAVVLGADTVVDVDGIAFGKPRDRAHARTMLETLSGREHVVHTAIHLIDTARAQNAHHVESTTVRFMQLDAATIDDYVASGEPMDKAGAYGIQGFGATLVERIDGDFYTVMGLPLAQLSVLLRALGYSLLQHS